MSKNDYEVSVMTYAPPTGSHGPYVVVFRLGEGEWSAEVAKTAKDADRLATEKKLILSRAPRFYD